MNIFEDKLDKNLPPNADIFDCRLLLFIAYFLVMSKILSFGKESCKLQVKIVKAVLAHVEIPMNKYGISSSYNFHSACI